jgi:hypothetical protein
MNGFIYIWRLHNENHQILFEKRVGLGRLTEYNRWGELVQCTLYASVE